MAAKKASAQKKKASAKKKKAPAQKKKAPAQKKAVFQLQPKPRLRVHEMSLEARSRASDAKDRRMAARAQEAKDKKRAALAPWAHLPFREQIRGRAAAIDDDQRVLIERLVSVHFNGSLKMHAGPKERLVGLSPFQLAFMDLLYPLHYEEFVAPATSRLEDYYATEPDKFAMKEFTADVQGIVLPTETSDRWEIRFAREIGAALVVCDMNGWTMEDITLVG